MKLSEIISSARAITGWIWAVLVGFAGMVGTVVALWTSNVASPSDVKRIHDDIMIEMNSRSKLRDLEIKHLKENQERTESYMKWMVLRMGGNPEKIHNSP